MDVKKMVEEILSSKDCVKKMQYDLREMESALKKELLNKGMVEFLNVNYGALHRTFICGGEKKVR